MSNVTVSRLGEEAQKDLELPFEERAGRSFIEIDPWAQSRKANYKDILAVGLVLAAGWALVLAVAALSRLFFCWDGCQWTTEGQIANVLFWLVLVAPAVGGVAWGGIAAWGKYAETKARAGRVGITRDKYGNPLPVSLVAAKTQELAAAELLLATRAAISIAPHQIFRGVDSLSISNNTGKAKVEEDGLGLLAEAGPNVGPLPLAEWTAFVDRQPHSLLAAKTGGGKSTLARFLLAGRINAGENLFIIDPHWSPSNWWGLPGVGGGENWSQIERAFEAVIAEYTARLDEFKGGRDTGSFTRLTVLLDEAVICKAEFDKRGKNNPWSRFVTVLGSGARKVRLSVVLMSQSSNVADLGISGPLRENYSRLALDQRTIRQLIEDDGSRSRRDALYAGLPAQGDYPAAAEINGEVFFLDRSAVVSVPAPLDAWDALWDGWDYERGAPRRAYSGGAVTEPLGQPVGRDKGLLEGLLSQNNETDRPTDRDEVMDFLVACAREGMTRDLAYKAARAKGFSIGGGRYEWGAIRALAAEE